jgi:hypothetical protein
LRGVFDGFWHPGDLPDDSSGDFEWGEIRRTFAAQKPTDSADPPQMEMGVERGLGCACDQIVRPKLAEN